MSGNHAATCWQKLAADFPSFKIGSSYSLRSAEYQTH
jgi:hypothetical protein